MIPTIGDDSDMTMCMDLLQVLTQISKKKFKWHSKAPMSKKVTTIMRKKGSHIDLSIVQSMERD